MIREIGGQYPKPSAFGMMTDMRTVVAALTFIFLSPFVFDVSAGLRPQRPVEQVYRRYCVSCHGLDGRAQTSKGKFSHARDLSDAQWQAEVSDERIFNSIMNGRNVRGNMPSFSNKINEKEINSLVDFVRRLKGPQQP